METGQAFRVRKQQSSNVIQRIKSQADMATKQNEIAGAFAEFYKSLYNNADTCNDFAKLSKYLKHIKLTELTSCGTR